MKILDKSFLHFLNVCVGVSLFFGSSSSIFEPVVLSSGPKLFHTEPKSVEHPKDRTKIY